MSSVVESVKEDRLSDKSHYGFDLLFGILPLVFLAPLLAIEFPLLWRSPAMRFFPIPIAIVACFAVWHFRSPRSCRPRRVLVARLLFLIGVACFGLAFWRFSPWLAHVSLVLFFVSWATERFGEITWHRIFGWGALLATSMRLPGDFQSQLQNWLVQRSAETLGFILDGLSIPYLILADRFSTRGLEFSLREYCDSLYGIHALASVVVLLLLLTRRSLFVGILSLLLVPLWAVIQQVLLLLAIVLTKYYGERDASQGLDHTIIELGLFLLIVVCCWVTTWFLAKMFLPVPAVDPQFDPEFVMLNTIVCWPLPDPFAIVEPQVQPSIVPLQRSPSSGQWILRASWVGVFGLIMLGLLSTHRLLYAGFENASWLPPVQSEQLARTEWKDFFPEVFDRWRRMDVTHQMQLIDGSERATINWHFGWQGQVLQLSVTLPFKGQQGLASKYEALGWRVLSVQNKQLEAASPSLGDSTKETWTELRISNELGGQALAIVTYHPLLQPSTTRTLPKDSLHPDIEYQVVLFCESGEQLTAPQLSELYYGFKLANEQVRKEVEPRLRDLLGASQ